MKLYELVIGTMTFTLVYLWIKARFYRRMWNKELDGHIETLREHKKDLEEKQAWKNYLCGDSPFYVLYDQDGDRKRKDWQPATTETANEWPEEIR